MDLPRPANWTEQQWIEFLAYLESISYQLGIMEWSGQDDYKGYFAGAEYRGDAFK
jgi:hypothetical protein